MITEGSLDSRELVELAAFLNKVFHNSSLFSLDYLKWQYLENPDGAACTMFARLRGELVAHYALIPISMVIDGEVATGGLSLNTAVSDQARGRGYFKRLANMTYDLAAARGLQYVIGVANSNSTPGFVRSLGFELVGPLDANIKIGGLPTLPDDVAPNFRKHWDDERLHWRLSRPSTNYQIVEDAGVGVICTRAGFFDVCCRQLQLKMAKELAEQSNLALRQNFPLRPKLWIGKTPRLGRTQRSLPIPGRLRPSPLNLIFKNLVGHKVEIDFDAAQVEIFDFDAY